MNVGHKKWWILISMIAGMIVLLTIFAAPSNNKLLAGSTFSRNPNGYGAWYQYMLDKEVNIERWQKPVSELNKINNKASFLKVLPPQTRQFYRLSKPEHDWVKQGNNIVILGIDSTVTAASFSSTQSYKDLNIKIATTRRKELENNSILQDNYGAIVWQENIGKGKAIYAVTPYIAANAYQSNLDNYQFLAELVNQNSLILVDEYLHGYKDREAIQKESETKRSTILSYFSKTIWLPIAIQIIIILIIAIASKLRRFGQPNRVSQIQIDNSQAYIQALAGVLEKAECSNFVVKKITKDEKLQLQKSLGLGKVSILDRELIHEWEQATGKNSKQLQKLLRLAQNDSRLKYSELVKWLQQWQQFHHNN